MFPKDTAIAMASKAIPVVLFWHAWRIKAAHFPADVAVCGHNSKSEANRRRSSNDTGYFLSLVKCWFV
jgi:hypothetical protein